MVNFSPSTLLAQKSKLSKLRASLFPEQRAAIDDPTTKKLYWTTGRAGKTRTILSDFFLDGMTHSHCRYIYVALTGESANEIAWPEAKEINRTFGLGCEFIDSKNRINMPTGSWIKIYGADKPGWMTRLYGQKFRRTAIDEGAFFKVDLRSFVIDILEPRAIDLDGQIILASIPGFLPVGLFHDIIKGFGPRRNMAGVRSLSEPGWSCHSWTTGDNPYMASKFLAKRDELEQENPDIINDPRHRRNYYGESVVERGQRVYNFDEEKNGIDGPREFRTGDHYVLGLDFGWDDATAFSLNVWRDDEPEFIEVESYKEEGMMLDKAAAYVRGYMALVEKYGDIEIVGDPAHKQLFEEFRRRYDLPVMPAEKPNKYDWIELWNSDAFRSLIKIANYQDSPHKEEMDGLTWKVFPTGKKIEQPGSPNDCCDAHLVAYRHAYHYRYEEPEQEIPPEVREEQEMFELAQKGGQSNEWWE